MKYNRRNELAKRTERLGFLAAISRFTPSALLLAALLTAGICLPSYAGTPPLSCFTAVPENVGCGEPVNVDAACTIQPDPTATIVRYEWDYDADGRADAVGEFQQHVFSHLGQYPIALSVVDSQGLSATTQKTVTVQPQSAPVAAPGGPYVLLTSSTSGTRTGDDLILDGQSSTDPDMACGDTIVTYQWDVNADGVFTDATGVRPVLSWAALAGLFTAAGISVENVLADPTTGQPRLAVRLRVTDSTGRTHEAITSLTLYDDMPHASFAVSPEDAGCGRDIAFDATGSRHGNPARRIVAHDWDFDVPEAGVASPDPAAIRDAFTADAQGVGLTHTYPLFGVYHPVLRVTDDLGRTDYAWGPQVRVIHGNHAPEVNAGGPYRVLLGNMLQLDGSATMDPDAACGDALISFAWDLDNDGAFDDAEGVTPSIAWVSLSGMIISQTTLPTDPHTGLPVARVALQVTDGFGASSVARTTLSTFDNRPFAVADWAPRPAVPVDVLGYAQVRLDASASYHGDPARSLTGWSFRLQEGAQSFQGKIATMDVDLSGALPLPAGGVNRTVLLRVSDDLGQTDEIPFDVMFQQLPAAPPTITMNDPATSPVVSGDANADGRVDLADAVACLKIAAGTAVTGVNALADVTGDQRLGAAEAVFALQAEAGFGRAAPMVSAARTIQAGEGIEIPASATGPGDLWILRVAWDLNGDGVDDLIHTRTDTNGDGTVDGSDAEPLFSLSLSWAQLSSWPGLQSVGSHLLRLTVTNSAGVSAEATVPFTVVDHLLVAEASVAPSSGGCHTVFTFDGSQSRSLAPGGSIAAWQWDLDADGTMDRTGPIVEHAFDTVGTFPVTLRVIDATGHEFSTSVLVTTDSGNLPPVPRAGGPYFADAVTRAGVFLDAANSLEPDVACGDRIVVYRWDLDGPQDGSPRTWEVETTAPTVQVPWSALTNVPWNNPDYRITLEVEDTHGMTAQAEAALLIADPSPVAVFTMVPTIAACGQEVGFDASASFTPVPNGTLFYDWDLHYDQMSFQPDGAYSGMSTFTTRFPAMGDVMVALRVSDDAGRFSTVMHAVSVSVGNRPPVAVAPGAVSGTWNQPLELAGSASFDPDAECGDSIIAWDWDLNADGTYEVRSPTAAITVPWATLSGYGLFQKADPATGEPSYPIRLRVMDRSGETTATATRLRLYSDVPTAMASVAPQSAGCGVDMVFSAEGSHAGSPDRRIAWYLWDLDIAVDSDEDGDPANDRDLETDQVTAVSRYLVPGTHTARLTVADDAGATATAGVSATMSYTNFAPVADAGGPYLTTLVNAALVPVTLDGSGSMDPNAPCDAIVRWAWDTDNDGLYGTDDAGPGHLCGDTDCEGETVPELALPNWAVGTSHPVALKVTDANGAVSYPSATSIQVGSTLPPLVEILSPNGGESLSGTAPLLLRVAHGMGETVLLQLKVNGTTVPIIGDTTVTTETGGAFVDVVCAFATTVLADAAFGYRALITASLESQPLVTASVMSRSPFTVDNTPPLLTLPTGEQNPVVEQGGPEGAIFAFHPVVGDAIDPAPVWTISPDLAIYPPGATVVVLTATDAAGNGTTIETTVTVTDTTPPVVYLGSDMILEATDPDGSVIPISASAWDAVDPDPEITSDSPASGFPVGTTIVTFTATDFSGNSSTGSLTVTVTDTTPPLVFFPQPPGVRLPQTDPWGAPFSPVDLPYVWAADNGTPPEAIAWTLFVTLVDDAGVDIPPPSLGYAADGSNVPAGFYPPGNTPIHYRVSDAYGNFTETVISVTVGP